MASFNPLDMFTTVASMLGMDFLNKKAEIDAAQSALEGEELAEQGRENALSRMRQKLWDQMLQGYNASIDRMGQII